jgi:putative flippase GtrA
VQQLVPTLVAAEVRGAWDQALLSGQPTGCTMLTSHIKACTCFTACGFEKVPQYLWFMLSGALCDVVQALIDYCIYLLYTMEWERATVCWTASYTLSIIVRHSSHRLLVFGDYEGSYCMSLARTYLTYSSSIMISMITNHLLVAFLELTHQQAWIITMIWTGVYNYFMLRASWRQTPATKGSASASSGPPAEVEKKASKQEKLSA